MLPGLQISFPFAVACSHVLGKHHQHWEEQEGRSGITRSLPRCCHPLLQYLFPAGKPFSLCNMWQGRPSQHVASELDLL